MKTKYTELISRYRLDYVLYLIAIVFLDIFALLYPESLAPLIAIGVAWVPLAWHALEDLKEWRIGTDFFIVFASVVAFMGHEYLAIIIILLILHIAHYIELLIENRTERAIEQLVKLMPSSVVVMQDEQEQVVSLAHVKPSMNILVKTGGRLPVDGYIIAGQALINQAALTGESVPAQKKTGDQVFAGTFLEEGSIVVRVEQVQQETLFGKMIALFTQAEEKKSRIEILAQRAAFWLTPIILLMVAFFWVYTGDRNLVMTLLIFGSPLELSLVTPLAVISATVAAFRKGIIIKGGKALDHMASVDAMMFDKTGTLTLGEPVVFSVESFDQAYTTNEIIRLAAIAERRSDHVIARALLAKAEQLKLLIDQPNEYISLVGHGIEMVYQGERYFIGNRHFVEDAEHGNCLMPEHAKLSAIDTTASIFYLATKGHVVGVIMLIDTIRPEAKETLHALETSGINTMILASGDREGVTKKIAGQLGIQQYYAEVFPEQKLEILDRLQQSGLTVAMVGDGINDAAALKQAHVGIAMGAMGMEPAIDAADVVLMTNNLAHIVFVRRLSLAVRRIIRQNLLFGFLCVHILGVILTLLNLVHPIEAALFHAVADLLIVLNASRLIFFE